jgi:predicted TIM-barrel fold metal-dependent hydrolase
VLTDAEVPRFWAELGLPGLIDVHVHFYPARMLRKVWAYFDDAARYGIEWPITYRWPDEARVAHLDAMGVRAYPALSYAHLPGMAADLTAWSLDFAARNPGCLPSGTFYPEPGALAEVDKALAAGVRVFKVHVQVGDFDPRDELLDPVWGRLAEAGTPVVVHAGSGPMPGRHTGPEPLAAVLARHPRLTAVVAHLGVPEYAEFLALAERYERVHLDTTMACTDFLERLVPYPRELLPRLRDLGLAGRVLLGSDFPNIPYPYAHQLESLARLDLGDDWLRAVCWRGAYELFELRGYFPGGSGTKDT